jgi:hypothetical protein
MRAFSRAGADETEDIFLVIHSASDRRTGVERVRLLDSLADVKLEKARPVGEVVLELAVVHLVRLLHHDLVRTPHRVHLGFFFLRDA